MPEGLDPAPCVIDGGLEVSDGAVITVVDPYSEQSMGSTREAGGDTVDRAVRSSVAAAEAWRVTDVTDRAGLLERVADLIDRDRDRISSLVTSEMGMPTALSKATQADLPAAVLRATAAEAMRFPWQEDIDGATLLRSGAGVVGAITPWNMPVHQIIAKVAGAVAAGSTVVLKASEQTPYDAAAIAELFLEAGAPAGLFNVVTGTGPVTGAALAGHSGLARLSFTGSVRAGRDVARLAAGTLTRCALELGGTSPAIILPDADLDRAVPSAMASGFVNSGQACNAPTRLLVSRDQLDDVADRIQVAVQSMVLGDPRDPSTTLGPLVSSRQRDVVLAHVAGALAEGGTLLTGISGRSERHKSGYFVEPTVITGLAENARAVREEIFGPVVVVQTYVDVDDAVRLANDSDYGLSAEVWSSDNVLSHDVAERLRVGQVKVNGVRTRNRPLVPFGGMRDSGYGRELGHLGIDEFTDVTAVMS